MNTNSNKIPTILRVWFWLLVLWSLSYTSFTTELRGFRFVHYFYYFDFILPWAFFSIIFKQKAGSTPKLLWIFGSWILIMGIYGVFQDYSYSIIYDRTRNLISMVLLLLLLHRYKVNYRQLIQLLIPVFFASMIGYPLAALFPVVKFGQVIGIRDIPAFNFMAAAYFLAQYLINRKLYIWFFWAFGAAFVVTILTASRAKLIAMTFSMGITIIRYSWRNLHRSFSILTVSLIILVSLVIFLVPYDEFKAKSIRGPGLLIYNLIDTSEVRLSELDAIKYQMSGIDYFIGKGTGANWDGQGIYISENGIERSTFHIYYFEIVYFFGAIGLILWFLIGILPVVKGFLYFHSLNVLGVMGLCSQIALLLAWFGHAGYSVCESSYIAVSLYAIHIGTKKE